MKLSLATSLLFLLGMAAALPADAATSSEDAESLEALAAAGAIKVRIVAALQPAWTQLMRST